VVGGPASAAPQVAAMPATNGIFYALGAATSPSPSHASASPKGFFVALAAYQQLHE